jgi:RNA-directed DNA polymerase
LKRTRKGTITGRGAKRPRGAQRWNVSSDHANVTKKVRSNREPRFQFSHSSNRKKCQEFVLDTQTKIALVVKNGNMSHAERFATILVRSKKAALLAVYRIQTNPGFRSPGWPSPLRILRTNQEYHKLVSDVGACVRNLKNYKPDPLYRIYLPKPGTKKLCPISVASYRDRALQALYLMALEPYAEAHAAYDSYGFRKGHSPIWAVYRVLQLMNHFNTRFVQVMKLDIQGCFDNISHEFVLNNRPHPIVPTLVLRKWLRCGFVVPSNVQQPEGFDMSMAGKWLPTDTGVPQGSIISPTIANIVLDEIDPSYGRTKGRVPGREAKSYLIRFADNSVSLVPPNQNFQEFTNRVKKVLAERGVQVNDAKTSVINLDLSKPVKFTFCGYEFLVLRHRNKRGKETHLVHARPDPKNIRKHKQTLKNLMHSSYTLSSFIRRANPVITGYCNFYRFGNSSKNFTDLSRWLYFRVNNWLIRRKG